MSGAGSMSYSRANLKGRFAEWLGQGLIKDKPMGIDSEMAVVWLHWLATMRVVVARVALVLLVGA